LAEIIEKRRISLVAIRLVAWSVMPLAFFTISTGKQPRYILPCLVPIVILVAREVWTRAAARRDTLVTAAGLAIGGSLIAIGALAYRLAAILRAADPHWTATGPVVLTVAGLTTVIASLAASQRVRLGIWLAAAGISALAIEATVYWPTRPEPV